MPDARIPGLYRQGIAARIRELESRGWLSAEDARRLGNGHHLLSVAAADTMIENVIATFALPLAIAPNFIVNGVERLVPLVVEEPSIVAALSGAARMARCTGGFTAAAETAMLTGQIHVSAMTDADKAKAALEGAAAHLLDAANAVHPRMLERGGGAREIEIRKLCMDDGSDLLVVHLHVDSCDAMGANLVNTMCEALAPQVAEIAGGRIALRILSNLTDRSLVTAGVRLPLKVLADDPGEAAVIRDGIILADRIAHADPYRAATHNKGIMNGIDPLVIATGNDWRAIEAGAHAFACRDGQYRSLTCWKSAENGDLVGEITVPLKPGVVGGTIAANPATRVCLRMTGISSARELAELMAAVGLAQNFAALRALAGTGIQAGHMRLHARSVAASAGASPDMLDDVVAELLEDGDVKEWKAREIVQARNSVREAGEPGAGKVILLGEHAVVYGRHALAIPIPNAVSAVALADSSEQITIPEWNIRESVAADARNGLAHAVRLIATELGVPDARVSIQLHTRLPRAMGLGSSAAMAVAITRAVARACSVDIADDEVNRIAFECEKLAHGTPSGVDNTLACFAEPMLFRRTDQLLAQPLELEHAPPLVIAYGDQAGQTIEQVAAVRARREQQEAFYESLFDEIDALSVAGSEALLASNYAELGGLMNMCHGLLNALQVSTPQLETMVALARHSGAIGAKLTGAGGGGSIVALCPGKQEAVSRAMHEAGFRTLALQTKTRKKH